MSQKFKKAKFRNAEFFVSDSDAEFGRRQVLHEYPQKDVPFSEDMGKKAEQFTVEGYVVGDNIETEKTALIDAVSQSGPGILIHPYYGQKSVVVTSCRVKESSGELRVVRFSLSFTEAGEITLPSSIIDTKTSLKNSTSILGDSAIARFAERFSVNGRPQFVVDSAIEKIKSATARVSGLADSGTNAFQPAADLAYSLRNFNASVSDLVNQPAQLAQQFRSVMGLLTNTFNDTVSGSRDAFRAQTAFFAFGSTDVPVVQATENRIAEETNRRELNALIQSLAFEQATNAAVEIEYTNLEEATGTRDVLLDEINRKELDLDDDEVYIAFIDVRAQIVKSIPSPDQQLPSTSEYTPNLTTNSLALSYELYGSIDRESDIVSRNKISHPGFIIGGQALEVLTNE